MTFSQCLTWLCIVNVHMNFSPNTYNTAASHSKYKILCVGLVLLTQADINICFLLRTTISLAFSIQLVRKLCLCICVSIKMLLLLLYTMNSERFSFVFIRKIYFKKNKIES